MLAIGLSFLITGAVILIFGLGYTMGKSETIEIKGEDN